jgi:transcriptional regulator with XRE-family HTH domain
MPVFAALGKAMRWLRAKQDRRQYEVAAAAGVTKAMLSAYETGKQKPSLETLEKILEALGADLADLHDALLIVNDRSGPPGGMARPGGGAAWEAHRDRRRRPGAGEEAGEGGDAFEVNVYRVLGLARPLPAEEERAFAEMLSGFHRLIRYMHRSLEETAAGAGGRPARPPRPGGPPAADDPADG